MKTLFRDIQARVHDLKRKSYRLTIEDNTIKNVLYWFLITNKYKFICTKLNDNYVFDMKLKSKHYEKLETLLNYLEG